MNDENTVNYIKQLVSSSIEYFEESLKVIPVSDSLLLEPPCAAWYTLNDYINCVYFYPEYFGINFTCGHVTVPDKHYGNRWIYNLTYLTGEARDKTPFGDAGPGIYNADYVVYVSANDEFCGTSTLAWATVCIQDQFGRPVAGTINICSNMFDTQEWKLDVDTVTHELTHALVMDPDIWPDFIDDTGRYALNKQTKTQQIQPVV